MLIQFSVSNYRSIHQVQTLNFRATGLVSENKEVDKRNILQVRDDGILKIAGIYGANASGKSNIIKSLVFFKEKVTHSLNPNITRFSGLGISPFKLSATPMGNGGFFEMVLLVDEKKFRYGFTLDLSGEILAEWLFGPGEKNETYYFTRKNNVVEVNQLWFQEGDDLPKEKLRSGALFLSFCASYNGSVSGSIMNFISDKMFVDPTSVSPLELAFLSQFPNFYTDNLIESGKKELVLRHLREAGLFFADLDLEKIELSGKILGNTVLVYKNVYDKSGKITGRISMNLETDESDGTRKFYSYVGILTERFENGGVLIADEIDSNFHPSLLKKLIGDFNNPNVNKAGAQLLFTSHDTNLMDPDIMRRDQFYFTEKSLRDETILYSLSDLKGIRNNADFARQYLAGVYGALPVLGRYLEEPEEPETIKS